MKKFNWLILINLLLVLGYFLYSIMEKEKLLTTGQLVLLELAPVDPRSLMQGDYMQLNYKIARDFSEDSVPKRGFLVVKLDQAGVASPVRIQSDGKPIQPGEQLIRYTAPEPWNINIGAESYFFQEGKAANYDSARYGGLRIDTKGNSLLVGLYDKNRKLIK
ncbi:GDYXXLXY domain-containing protein [Flavihumibacter sp. RY-1]|uniref:GDYXXLXY domain-containing protein n=1 Tax=Flavihumibacter fluminis TaxID=2909236 RepID=A0ABS9BKI7_9BACT|nr:GDYXXLXY domain-containing protein [Flavihumibacter fluminis]MCF1715653.1 GDYXXLXY domain-containing protein [Flavihumibacter fluminis]